MVRGCDGSKLEWSNPRTLKPSPSHRRTLEPSNHQTFDPLFPRNARHWTAPDSCKLPDAEVPMRSPSFVPVARPYSLICAVISIALATAVPASAQQLSGWTGAIRCEIQAQAQGYSHRETQTWTLTGAAPTVQGSVTAYPTTWTVVGGGQHDRSTPATRRIAQWTASVAGSPPRSALRSMPWGARSMSRNGTRS